MNINYDYLERVRRLAKLFTMRKTSDLLEGDYSSRAHGRSLDFDDLREYRYGDEISDIDWKSSSRTGKLLVRRYFAERRHNAVFVCDCGSKMSGDTPAGENKAHLALMTFGVSAYLFDKQGVKYAMASSGKQGDAISGFLSGANHLEELLAAYQRALDGSEPAHSLSELLEHVSGSFSRHMILVIITDSEGMAGIDETLLRRLIHFCDVYILKIEDAFLTTPGVYDLQAGRFEDLFLASDALLHREEVALRQRMDEAAEQMMRRYRVFFRTIAREEEIVDALTGLLRQRKGA